MSYLSTTENVGFSGIPQNISDASCATQYKMAVEGVSGSCGDVNMFSHDSSGDEQTYITHLNDNYFHTKFKIDPNDLYTFHDSDVIAGEITVSHTEDNLIFNENVDIKTKLLESPSKDIDLIGSLTNGDVKEVKQDLVPNGHYPPMTKSLSAETYRDVTIVSTTSKDRKVANAKAQKTRSISVKEPLRTNSIIEIRRPSVHSPEGQCSDSSTALVKSSITSVNSSITSNNIKATSVTKVTGMETFLDVYKREQGLVASTPADIAEVPVQPLPVQPLPVQPLPPVKLPAPTTKKPPSASKAPPQSKARRGRGPAVHEALQRIPAQRRALPAASRAWHAPGWDLFQCGPLDGARTVPFTQLESSSSDDDNMPDFEAGTGPVCVEESAAESRGARLALRRAALRRHVTQARTALRLAPGFRDHHALANIIKKQLHGQGPSCRLPAHTVSQLLATRGMPAVLTVQERRRLRENGWSGGESGSTESGTTCVEERCPRPPLPCARHCLAHVTQAPEQRLYAACAAVFAGGTRCMQPLLPLQDQTPLCTEHAWKRDNYDKQSRDARPRKPAAARRRACPPPPRPPRRAKRRRKPPPRPRPSPHQSLSEINVCSNSSACDSAEDAAMGALSETEFVVSASNSHALEVEVGQVPTDDILDPAVLSQIPDEAFTEFFNQAEGAAPFAESSELAAALEAVLDERALDSIAESVFTHHQAARHKIQLVPAPVSTQPSAPS